MKGLGRFLEFSVPTTDILDSLDYYRLLGFSEAAVGDIWPHRYAVVSDGILNIGLHTGRFDAPTLTFVRSELAQDAERLAEHGFEFTTQRVGDDSFNELGLEDRYGHAVAILEARTFSGVDEFDDDSACGTWLELTLPVSDAVHAAAFWGPLASTALRIREEPPTHLRFNVSSLPLGLSEHQALRQPALCFKCHDTNALVQLLDQHGLPYARSPDFENALIRLIAPESTMIFIFAEDFLGELYEVDESGARDDSLH